MWLQRSSIKQMNVYDSSAKNFYIHTHTWVFVPLRALFSRCFWQNKYMPQLGQPNYNESCVLYLRSLWIFSYQEGNRRRCVLWLANLTVIFLDSLGQVTKTSGTNGQKKFKICIEVFLFPFALSQSISLLTKRARGDKEHNKDEMRGKDL